ncbi:uncharacterized protein N7484_010178 [Penicillium longicatenatum]|uniref:uncharacterized protein n=1 Tax=Penicillium longicatenatum TaxID=1561947 RepID=UPI002546591A|nr:uncharacterized protein N7484_010178 [Penicillium longicatenatum]KAJ5636865.1 hypothetical protein N7484_010178 [Penicillium longicatenatum]
MTQLENTPTSSQDARRDSSLDSRARGSRSPPQPQNSSKVNRTPPFVSMDTALENDIKRRFLDMEVSIKLSEMAKLAPKFRNTLFREDTPGEPRASSSNALVLYRDSDELIRPPVNVASGQIITDRRRSVPVGDAPETDEGIYSLPLLYTDVRINQFMVRGMLDSGLGLNVIGKREARELSHPIRRDP